MGVDSDSAESWAGDNRSSVKAHSRPVVATGEDSALPESPPRERHDLRVTLLEIKCFEGEGPVTIRTVRFP